VGNWTAAPTNAADRVTPGRANAGATALGTFPSVWINEVLPVNMAGPRDNAGDREPYVEVFNTGDSPLDLGGLFLTDTWTNRLKWSFPLGSMVPPKGFLTVWCDGQQSQSASGVPHASFRLSPTNGFIALVRNEGGASGSTVLDVVNWGTVPADRALGLVPDGVARTLQSLFYPTPGATNDPSFPEFRVSVNEIMAQNNTTLTDPADGHYEDWFELHNAGTNAVDLAGFYLTDRLTNAVTAMFRIPSGYPIPPGGFLRVWADNETGQNRATNADLHVNFALAREGEAVGLFDPRGGLVDGVTFGIQTNDVSLGRFPDGGPGPLFTMSVPTPGTTNVLAGGNRPPVVSSVAPISAPEQQSLEFTVLASDPDAGQEVRFSLGSDAPPGAVIDAVSGRFQWMPSELDGPAIHRFLVRAQDNGVPPRSGQTLVQVTILEVNRPPVVLPEVSLDAREGIEFRTRLEASDADRPLQALRFGLEGFVPEGMSLSIDGQLTWIPAETLGGSTQTVTYRVTDDGSPGLSVVGSLAIRVQEINNVPVFEAPPVQRLTEGSPWTANLLARDPEGTALRFRVDGAAPEGFALDPQTGVASWTPTEAQGPASVVVVVRAFDTSSESLSTVRELLLEVAEANEAPVLESIPPMAVDEGRTVSFTARASDPDQPAQALRFSLEPGAPAGATIDPVSGRFQWTPDDDAGALVQAISVRVTDDGPGSLSALRRFEVTVKPRFQGVFSEILRRSTPAGGEFVELVNRSAKTAWDFSGLRLSGSNLSFTFPAGTTVAPGSRVLVVANRVRMGEVFGLLPGVVGEWSGSLGSVADSLRLIRPAVPGGTEELLDRVDYDGLPPWPSGTQGTNRSLQVVDVRQDRNRPGNWAEAVPFQGSRRVIGFTDSWRYFQDGAPAGGTNWVSPGYNDSAWPTGGGLLHVESAELSTNKTTALTLGQPTFYFRRKVSMPALTAGVTVRFRVMLDDGYVLWVNGRRAHVLGMPEGEITHDTFANRTVGDAAIEGPFTLPSDLLVPGENSIAVEVHQSNAGSSDVVFGLEMTLEGGDASPATPGTANSVAAVLSPFPNLWLNEVLPANLNGPTDNAGNRDPYVEIINGGMAPIDLSGMHLTDDWNQRLKWAFPPGAVVPPLGLLVVWCDAQESQSLPGVPHASFRLNSTNGFVALVRDEGGLGATVLDSLHWQSPPADQSLGWLPDGLARVARGWLNPTPGATNDPTPPSPRTTRISGKVAYYLGAQAGVRGVSLATVEDPTRSVSSASDGGFTIEIPGYGPASLLPSRSSDFPLANGVTTADITLIRRHVLGLTPFDAPEKILAGDVNGSDSVTTADITLVRRLVLGVATNYPGGSLWRFVPSDEVLTDPNRPWTASRMRRYASLAGGLLGSQDFKAIKLGDVNGSWQATSASTASFAKARPQARLSLGKSGAGGGNAVSVPVFLEGLGELGSLQLTLAWDPQRLQFDGVDAVALVGLGDEHLGLARIADGLLSLSWDPPAGSPLDLTKRAELFRLRWRPGIKPAARSEIRMAGAPTQLEVTDGHHSVAASLEPGWVEIGGSASMDHRPGLRVVGIDADGVLQLEVSAVEGMSLVLEGSDSLGNWVPVRRISGQGLAVPTRIGLDASARGHHRFWRLAGAPSPD
jgi:hypothetical protein